MHRLTLIALLFVSSAFAEKLFDGKTLKGWELCNGKASYKVVNGTIVGTTAEGSPNSFLCTTKEYGDFVLELDSWNDPALNSGVQIRSHRYPAEMSVKTFDGKKIVDRKQPKDRVHGYQVEIATAASGASGGIYDEARRGWVDNISSNPTASKAFKDNQWNHYKIEAIGDHIRTWVNGVPCADLLDGMDQTGFIALQVHQFKGDKPAQVRFRNIEIKDLGRHQWKTVSTANWTKQGGNWNVEDGAIHATSDMNDPKIGFMVSDQTYKDVALRFKFKIDKGNSGFFVRCDKTTHAGYEIEIDEAKRTGGYWHAGGRSWVTGPEDNAGVFPNQWNEITAMFHGHRIAFYLNGVKTVDIAEDAPGRLEGHIALQAHGNKRPTSVWFKDIEILEPAPKK